MKGKKFPWVLGIAYLIIVALVCLVLHKQISNLIQAVAVITLAFITFYYAVQTQKLVEEEKKKRDLDFLEKRIGEFYWPFTRNLEELKQELSRKDIDNDKVDEILKKIGDCIYGKRYMTRSDTIKAIHKLMPYILQARNPRDPKYFHQFLETAERVKKDLNAEWENLEKILRKSHDIEDNEEKA